MKAVKITDFTPGDKERAERARLVREITQHFTEMFGPEGNFAVFFVKGDGDVCSIVTNWTALDLAKMLYDFLDTMPDNLRAGTGGRPN